MSEQEPQVIKFEDSKWVPPKSVSFVEKASLQIARWILLIFTLVCVCTFILIFFAFRRDDATFDGIVDLVQFPMISIIPLVSLVIGYYMGNKDS